MRRIVIYEPGENIGVFQNALAITNGIADNSELYYDDDEEQEECYEVEEFLWFKFDPNFSFLGDYISEIQAIRHAHLDATKTRELVGVSI